MLTGLPRHDNTTGYPFNPNPDAYKPTNVTGAPAASVDLAVTDPNFKFPQTWRTNIGFDQKLPWGLVGHRRVHLQPGRQRHGVHQRQPAGGTVGVHRGGQPPAVGGDHRVSSLRLGRAGRARA